METEEAASEDEIRRQWADGIGRPLSFFFILMLLAQGVKMPGAWGQRPQSGTSTGHTRGKRLSHQTRLPSPRFREEPNEKGALS